MIKYLLPRRIAVNLLTLLVMQAINFFVQFIYTIYLVRYLGTIGYGRFSFALTFVQMFSSIMLLGLDTLIVKEVSGRREIADKILANVLGIQTIASILFFGIIFTIINIMAYPMETKMTVYVFGISIIIYSIVQSFLFMFRAFEKMQYEAVGTTIAGLINILLGFYIIFSKRGNIVDLAFAYCISNIFFLVYVIVICWKKFFFPKIIMDFVTWINLLRSSIPFGLGSIFYLMYSKVDTIMLSKIHGDAQVGAYNAANKLVNIFLFFSVAFYGSIFPAISSLYKNSFDSLKLVTEKVCKYISIIVFPIAIIVCFLAGKIINYLYGERFILSVNTLRILIWIIVITYLGNNFAYLLISSKKSNMYALFSGVGLILNITLNILIIPKYGLIGAAIVSVSTSLVVTWLIYEYVSQNIFRISLIRATKKTIFASLLLVLYLYFCRISNTAILISSSVVFYFAVFFFVRGFSRNDFKLIKIIFTKS